MTSALGDLADRFEQVVGHIWPWRLFDLGARDPSSPLTDAEVVCIVRSRGHLSGFNPTYSARPPSFVKRALQKEEGLFCSDNNHAPARLSSLCLLSMGESIRTLEPI